MRPLYTFTIKPSLPPQLERLRQLAGNLKWCWDHELMLIFRRLDEDLWEETGHNPLMMLGQIKQQSRSIAGFFCKFHMPENNSCNID